MNVVRARDFRSNQGRYLTAAKSGVPFLLSSKYGDFIITKASSEDSLTSRICRGLKEVKLMREGKLKGYSIDEALNEL